MKGWNLNFQSKDIFQMKMTIFALGGKGSCTMENIHTTGDDG